MDKATLRASMREARRRCDPAWGMRLAGHVLAGLAPRPGAVVAGYWPLANEIDVRPLLLALAGRGHAVALPATPERGAPLTFRRWRPGAAMTAGRFGTREAIGDVMMPGLLFLPLLAFDRRGGRLGYGGGYYDRTLAQAPGVVAVGCGFSAQEVDRVPMETHDRAMSAVATEAGVIVLE